MKKTIAMFLVIVLSLFVISACQVENEESGAGATSDNSSITSEANSSEESLTETSDDTSTPSETSEDTSAPDETSDDINDDEIASQVYEHFDKIVLPENTYMSEKEIIEMYPEDFAAIVALGEDAFPTLDEITENNEISELKRALAYYCKYTINPDLYDEVIVSPDGKYAIKIVVHSFVGIGTTKGHTYSFELIDNETNSTKPFNSDFYNNLSARWSTDSQYFYISYTYEYDMYEKVYSIEQDKFLETGMNKVESYIIENISDTFEMTLGNIFNVDEMIDESKIKMNVCLSGEDTLYEGWYIYDYVEEEIVDADIHKQEE